MKTLISLVSLVLLLGIYSCQRPLAEEDLIFRGDWSSSKYALQIYGNGYGVCQSKKWGIGLVCEGYVTITNNRIVFTSTEEHSTLARKKFSIDQLPTTDSSGTVYMILEGDRFEKH